MPLVYRALNKYHMRGLILILALALSGCSTVREWIPSFWDDNQSNYIALVRLHIEQINCDQEQQPQVQRVQTDLRLFELYSESKGSAQADVVRVVAPIKVTVDEWVQRGEGSKGYCMIKKKLLTQEADRAAKVILGRW